MYMVTPVCVSFSFYGWFDGYHSCPILTPSPTRVTE